ncbi:hypothetical protein [Alistipes ihumii]|uniref:hypothetical protein n=1 Tax=Alistipes ihumii TaxID=1470347 RepID=UPI0026731C0F|nr:hypothetical protein [Alistipes ihumii]
MTRKELERKLEQLGYLDLYSLDGSVGPDRVVLYKNYAVWEVFYIDERGNRTVPKLFSSEEEAYDYLYKEAVDMYELLHKDYGTTQGEIQPPITVRGDNFEMTYTRPTSETSEKKD